MMSRKATAMAASNATGADGYKMNRWSNVTAATPAVERHTNDLAVG